MTSAQLVAGTKSNGTILPRANSAASTRRWVAGWLIAVGLFADGLALGEGFRNSPPGTFDLGRAGGRIAQVDDSSAVTANPANLVDLTNWQLDIAPSIIYYHVSFQNLAGQEVDTKSPIKILPNMFASMPVGENSALGLGITVPYGLANEWNSDMTSPLRNAAPYFTELKTINVNPAFSTKLSDHFKAGVGLDVMWSQLTFNQFLTPLAPDLEARARGEGWGFGINAGVTWQLTERQRLAFTFRSPMTVNYRGHFILSSAPGPSETYFNSQIKFPTIVAVGYGIQATDKLRLESDLEWLQFSRFQSLQVNVGPNPAGVPSQTIPENWRNTITLGISGDYQLSPSWILRGGFQYYQTPVPDQTFAPTIPDANQNVITVGINYHHKRSDFEAGYGLDFYGHRDIRSDQVAAFDGNYRFSVHLFSLSYRLSF